MYTLAEIAAKIDGEVAGDGDLEIRSVGSLTSAVPGQITHLSSVKYQRFLPHTKASAVILREEHAELCPVSAVIVKNPALAYARLSQLFVARHRTEEGISADARLAQSVEVGKNVRIGAFVTVGEGSILADGVELAAGVRLGANVRIGELTVVHPNVTIYDDVVIGEECEIHANTTIGADGFGLVPDDVGMLFSIAQLGSVSVGNRVLMGAGCTVDRGAIENTVLEDGVKLDDQVHIGHNCRVGADSILCGCAGLAGSVTVGRNCVIGGGVGVAGDGPLRITDGVQIGSMAFVSRDILEPGLYSGNTLHNKNSIWRRNAMRFNELDQIAKRLKHLEKRVTKQSES